MGTLLKFYEDISLNVTADKSHKNFHLIVPNSLFTAEVFKKQFSIETFIVVKVEVHLFNWYYECHSEETVIGKSKNVLREAVHWEM